MNTEVRVAVIYGSTRNGRFCDTVAKWVAEVIAESAAFAVDIIDPMTDRLTDLQGRIAQADAFVVVTPEYNHGYPAALKALIDSVSAGWNAKAVAFVSYGGISGGLRAVEQLRLVFAELHAVTLRDTVSFANAWEQFDATGGLREPERARRAMATLLARLYWWAVALRNARSSVAYDSIQAVTLSVSPQRKEAKT